MKEKVALALSGGIDSSVCAYFLKEQGYDVHCFTMRLFDDQPLGFSQEKGCRATIAKAQKVAKKLDLPFEVIDLRAEFKRKILDAFLEKYQAGLTPNPCVDCNFHIKWGLFADILAENGFDKIASGHYAKVRHEAGKYKVFKAKDDTKDQTYFFWRLSQEQLARMFFPLSELKKSQMKELALDLGLVSDSSESQGVCFIENDYKELLRRLIGVNPGAVRLDGKKIGEHKGIAYYTIGQRRGLEIPHATPLYVKSKNAKTNAITVVEDRSLLATCSFYIKNANFFEVDFAGLSGLSVQVCYNTKAVAVVSLTPKGKGFLVQTKEPIKAVASGQSAVFYAGDLLVGGGEIG